MAAPLELLPLRRAGRVALLICVLAWLAERAAEASGTAPTWTAARLDDLVCLPLVLAAVLALHRLAGRPASWRLPLVHGLLVTAGYALFFELVLPHWDVRAVADGGDVLCYAAGFVVFQLLINRGGTAHLAGEQLIADAGGSSPTAAHLPPGQEGPQIHGHV